MNNDVCKITFSSLKSNILILKTTTKYIFQLFNITNGSNHTNGSADDDYHDGVLQSEIGTLTMTELVSLSQFCVLQLLSIRNVSVTHETLLMIRV